MRVVTLFIVVLLIAVIGLFVLQPRSSSPVFVSLNTEFKLPADETFNDETYLDAPRSIEIFGDTVFVADSGTDEIKLFNLSGEYLGEIGNRGHGPGEFSSIRTVKLAPSTSQLVVLDNLRVSTFSTKGLFVTSFVNPAATALDVLPNGQILLFIRTQRDQTNLSVFNIEGDLQRSFAQTSDLIPGDDTYRPLWSYSVVAVHEQEIWEAYLYFNVMRIHSLNGELLREFQLDDAHLISMDGFNRKRAARTGRKRTDNNRGFPTPTQINHVLKSSGGYLWLMTGPTKYIKEQESDYITKYFIYQIDHDGVVVARYICPKNTAKDFIILRSNDPFRAIIMNRGPDSSLIWVYESNQ